MFENIGDVFDFSSSPPPPSPLSLPGPSAQGGTGQCGPGNTSASCTGLILYAGVAGPQSGVPSSSWGTGADAVGVHAVSGEPGLAFDTIVNVSAGVGDVAVGVVTFGAGDAAAWRRIHDVGSVDTQSIAYNVGYWSAVVASVGIGRVFAPSNAARGLGSLGDLSRAAGALDRGGLSAAGRQLQKHGSRSGSAFPGARGNPAAINRQAQDIVDDLLTTPGTTAVTRHHARFGDVLEIRAPDGRGLRYGADGKFLGFLEPRP